MAKASGKVQDVYGNRAFSSVVMSAANTLTFEQIQFGVGLFQGVALILNRVEWFPDKAFLRELEAGTDDIQMALTNRDDLGSLAPTNQSVLVLKEIIPEMVGAVVSLWNYINPFISDFSGIPGGGLILPANPLYIAADSLGAAAAGTVRAVLYFTFKQLADSEYVELIQTIMPANL